MILFLDFDGVLHPSDVFLLNDEPVLIHPKDPDLKLFCWAPILESILDELDPAGEVKIILSTTWVVKLGLERARSYLPKSLLNRVISGLRQTVHYSPRGYLVGRHAFQKYPGRPWIALDDSVYDWPACYLGGLVPCTSDSGISDEVVIRDLKEKLKGLT